MRQVALGDPLGGRCLAPKEDRHTALCLLLELGAQKGSLAASLEAVVLLLTLWEKDKSTDDNRDVPQNAGAPLVPILKRYESIGNYGLTATPSSNVLPSSATECFLRFLTLPEQETSNVDLKQAAVVIISHLDRLAKPHMPTGHSIQTNYSVINRYSAAATMGKTSLINQSSQESGSCGAGGSIATNNNNNNMSSSTPQLHEQRIYALGWLSLNPHQNGFTAEPAVGMSTGAQTTYSQYSAPVLNFYFQVQQVVISEEYVLFLTQDGKMYTWRISKPETEPMLIDEMAEVHVISVAAHCEGRHYMAVDSLGNFVLILVNTRLVVNLSVCVLLQAMHILGATVLAVAWVMVILCLVNIPQKLIPSKARLNLFMLVALTVRPSHLMVPYILGGVVLTEDWVMAIRMISYYPRQ